MTVRNQRSTSLAIVARLSSSDSGRFRPVRPYTGAVGWFRRAGAGLAAGSAPRSRLGSVVSKSISFAHVRGHTIRTMPS